MCTAAEQEDITGAPTVSWMDPNGRLIQEGTSGDFTIIRHIAHVGQEITLSLQFDPLRVSHRGQYSCTVELGEISFSANMTYNLDVQTGKL